MISINDLHPLKALGPIELTEDGINIFLIDVHASNALSSIFVTDEEIIISDKFEF